MSKFTFPPSIKSRPGYGSLAARPGHTHLFIADAEGAEAILGIATPDLMAKSHIIFIPRGTVYGDQLRAFAPRQFYEGPSFAVAVPRVLRVLSDAKVGLQVYLSGTEGLMGQAQIEAMQAGIAGPSRAACNACIAKASPKTWRLTL
jgi:hypothetical protein